jgi:hypothetical protein
MLWGMVSQDGICPSLLERDISEPLKWSDQDKHGMLGLIVNLERIPNHSFEKKEVPDQISWDKGNNMYVMLQRFIWYDIYVRIGVGMSC